MTVEPGDSSSRRVWMPPGEAARLLDKCWCRIGFRAKTVPPDGTGRAAHGGRHRAVDQPSPPLPTTRSACLLGARSDPAPDSLICDA